MAGAEEIRTRPGRISQKWLLPLLALALAGISLMVLEVPETVQPPAEPVPDIEGTPDLIMSGATINQYRNSGELHYMLSAKEIRHFDPESLTRLTAPSLTLFGTGEAPWHGEAAYGYLRRATTGSAEEELVFLRKDVRLEQETPAGDHVRLTAPTLYLYPDREYAETEHDVMIESQVGRTQATGLQADLRNGLLKLTSRPDRPVHTTLLPDQFK